MPRGGPCDARIFSLDTEMNARSGDSFRRKIQVIKLLTTIVQSSTTFMDNGGIAVKFFTTTRHRCIHPDVITSQMGRQGCELQFLSWSGFDTKGL